MRSRWMGLASWVVGAASLALCACSSSTDTPLVDAGPSAGDSGCPEGSETCPCYGNGTCDAGLVCLSNLCVAPGVGGGGGETGERGVGGGAGVMTSGGAPTAMGGSAGAVGGETASGATMGSGGDGTGGSGTGGSGTGGSGTGGDVGAGGSGQVGAGGVTDCAPSEWKCGSGECIHDSYRCNGLVDCIDGSDEASCAGGGAAGATAGGTGGTGTCGADEWQCDSGECIDVQYVCDGIVHCPDVSDEVSCGTGGTAAGGTGGVGTGGGGTGGTGGASVGGNGGAGGDDCSEETANYPNLVNASGWVGCDPALSDDNPAGLQGAFFVYGDGITCAPPSGNPCASGSCCLDGATIVDDVTYESWGCGIGFQLNASDTELAELQPYQGSASCFAITLSGTSGSNPVRIGFAQGPGVSVVPFVEVPAVTGGRTDIVCFSDVACPSWATDTCSVTGEPYELQIQVVGAERASTFTLCLDALIPS